MASPSIGFSRNTIIRAPSSVLSKYKESNSKILVATSISRGARNVTKAKWKTVPFKVYLLNDMKERRGDRVGVKWQVPVNSIHYTTLIYKDISDGKIIDTRQTGGSGQQVFKPKPARVVSNPGGNVGVNRQSALDIPTKGISTALDRIFNPGLKEEQEAEIAEQQDAAIAFVDEEDVPRVVPRSDPRFDPVPTPRPPPARERREETPPVPERTAPPLPPAPIPGRTIPPPIEEPIPSELPPQEEPEMVPEPEEDEGYDDSEGAVQRIPINNPTILDEGDLIFDKIRIPIGKTEGKVDVTVKVDDVSRIIDYFVNSTFDPETGLVSFSGADAYISVNRKRAGPGIHFSHDPFNHADALPIDLNLDILPLIKKGTNIVSFSFVLEKPDALFDHFIAVTASRTIEYLDSGSQIPPGQGEPDPGYLPPDNIGGEESDDAVEDKDERSLYAIYVAAVSATIVGAYFGIKYYGSKAIYKKVQSKVERWRPVRH